MTEYELRDAITGVYAQASTDTTTVFSLVTGYLVVAYLVGAKLPRNQLAIVNCLYGGWVLMAIWAIKSSLEQGVRLTRMSLESGFAISIQSELGATLFFSLAFPTLLIAGVFASYYFMWSVRRPKRK